MSWLFAAIYDRFMREVEEKRFVPWRRQLLGDLAGEVLEVGAGTGANLPFYPPTVDKLLLAEPDRDMRARLARKLSGGGATAAGACEIVDAPLPELPFADQRFDAVVMTLVLCSVAEPGRALGELRRVLRPGGRLVFLEHVASADHAHRRWQERLEPMWRRVSGDCHLTRRTDEDIAAAGFTIERLERFSERRRLLLIRDTVRGVARSPAPLDAPHRRG